MPLAAPQAAPRPRLGSQRGLTSCCRSLRCLSRSGWAPLKSRRRTSSGGLACKGRSQGALPAGAVRVKVEHWEEQEEEASADEEPWEAEEAEEQAAKRRRSTHPAAKAGGKPRGQALVGARVELWLDTPGEVTKQFTGSVAEYLPGG